MNAGAFLPTSMPCDRAYHDAIACGHGRCYALALRAPADRRLLVAWSAPASPAWPKIAERETDGGESLAPRAGAVAIAAAKDDDADDATPRKPSTTPAAESPTPRRLPDEKPLGDSHTDGPAPEETITIDDIVIEIDE